MKLPLQINFRNMQRSPHIEELIRKRAEKLDEFCDQVMSCRVVVDLPHKHHHQGNQFKVRIDLSVPGKEIVVNREPDQNQAYEDINAALKDAFNAAARQLEDYVRERRRHVKTHAEAPQGRIVKLFPGEGYGFVETPDGREIYFHSNAVVKEKFDHLELGTSVTFVEELGEKGPQASTIRIVR